MKSKLKKAGRMPEVPRSAMIGQCDRCKAFRRLKDLSLNVCAVPCEPKIEPAPPPPPIGPNGYAINEPCANCDEWTDRKELELSEQHWCAECEQQSGPGEAQ